MSDVFDRAQEREQSDRDQAIAVVRKAADVPGRTTCLSCGDDITDRLAVYPSAQRCVDCQTAAERRGYLGRGA